MNNFNRILDSAFPKVGHRPRAVDFNSVQVRTRDAVGDGDADDETKLIRRAELVTTHARGARGLPC